MASETRFDHIYNRAHALAASGAHPSPRAIISVLVAEGYDEASELLNSDNIRADLSRLCATARPSEIQRSHWRFRARGKSQTSADV